MSPSSSASASSSSSRQSRSRRTARTSAVAVAALAVLVLASLPTATHADSPALGHNNAHHAALGSNNGHNQVHAANVYHVKGAHAKAASASTSSASASASASKSGKGKKHAGTSTQLPGAEETANTTGSGSAAIDSIASSNQLNALMRTSTDGLSKIYSLKHATTKLVGEGVDTIYSSNATACSRHYTVAEFDTCDIVGHKTHTSTYQIMALNLDKTGPDCYFLQTGMKLCLGRFGSDCQLVHRVRTDETCTSIVRHYDISRELLLDNNPNLDCPNIYDGLNLCVAPGRVAPPEPRGMYVARRSIKEL
ncbi:unnamed protein product [Tilletia laevis]|uniref:LysM domain-containing protein n=3 Tax=Tilletia TaxID=13289 RepID=A0A8X7MM99_9BASI|nr:hypothetical protein CF335_g6010 [Tilletia laevis]KAE8202934.1 hypothetical protein CF328_g1927 [Tilletia controversa]KAE8242145.1 hypothetical protein A4X06_0g7192 [Tilletia controversa]CAD6926252.1 unnamed protein product [Tilletia controversa]CAD6934623.1 unnamed protein product [Tilletia controversa]